MKNQITIVVVLLITVLVVGVLFVVQSGELQFGGGVNVAPDMPTVAALDTPLPTEIPPTFARPTLPPTWTSTPQLVTATESPTTELKIEAGGAADWYEQGVRAYWDLQPNEALNYLNHAIEIDPNLAEAYAYRAGVYRSWSDVDLAEQDLQTAERLAPDNPIVLTFLARWYAFQGDYPRAIEVGIRATELAPSSLRTHFHLARVYWDTYEYEKALEAFESALALEESHPSVASDYAILLNSFGRYDESITILENLVDTYPDFIHFYRALGATYREVGQIQDALDTFSVIETIDPNDVTGLLQRGYTYDLNDQYVLALSEYNRAIAIDSENADVYVSKALTLLHMGDSAGAMELLNKVISFAPNTPDAYYNRAILLTANDQFDAAIDDYLQTVHLDPRYHQAHMNLGNLYRGQSMFEDALAHYDMAIQVFPSFWFAYWNRGRAYSYMLEHDKEIADYQTAISIYPYYSPVYQSLGLAYLRSGEYELSFDAYEVAAELDPTCGECFYFIAVTSELTGDAEKAQENYQKAEDLGYQQ